jgi:hypothetical protein
MSAASRQRFLPGLDPLVGEQTDSAAAILSRSPLPSLM